MIDGEQVIPLLTEVNLCKRIKDYENPVSTG